jgi:hypothetical protein
VIIRIIYGWSHETPQQDLIRELSVHHEIITDWCNFIRDICVDWVENNQPFLGGHDDPYDVEVDESAFHRRKYNVGLYRPTQWVLGGIDRHSRQCFLEAVPNRNAATILPLLQKYIRPGSRIITDGWAAYADIDKLDHGIFPMFVLYMLRILLTQMTILFIHNVLKAFGRMSNVNCAISVGQVRIYSLHIWMSKYGVLIVLNVKIFFLIC